MAKRIDVLLIDDTDGTAAEETVTFSLDGVHYEIDLGAKNAARLRDSLTAWIGSATRTGGRRRTTRLTPVDEPHNSIKDLSVIRDWARQHGHRVSDRGRIPAAVQSAYDQAHP